MNSPPKRLCVVVVIDDAFLAGTLVTLHSLFEHTPQARSWDLVAFADPEISTCSSATRLAIAQVAPHAEVREVNRTEYRTFPVRSEGANISLLKLEAFLLEGWDAVLYMDTDLLFRASVVPLLKELTSGEPPVVGVENGSRATASRTYAFESLPMNAGLFAFEPQGAWLHAEMLATVAARAHLGIQHQMVCQPVVNTTLASLGWCYTAAPCFFNFRDLPRYPAFSDRVVVLHYISRTLGRGKPWNADAVIPEERAAHRAWHDQAARVVAEHPALSAYLPSVR